MPKPRQRCLTTLVSCTSRPRPAPKRQYRHLADGDVVEEDVAVGMAACRHEVAVQQKAGPSVGAARDYQQGRAAWQFFALLARAQGDDARYRDYRDRYRAMATSLGFDGHMKWADVL